MPAPLDVTNVEKLSLPLDTSVGTPVAVSDGFYVTGFGDARDGFYFPNGERNSHPRYVKTTPFVAETDPQFGADADSPPVWAFTTDNFESVQGGGAAEQPWEANGWDVTVPPLTLTHPALQQLASPDNTTKAAMFVDALGIFSKRGNDGTKDTFNLVGQPDSSGSGAAGAIYWQTVNDDFPTARFIITDTGDPVYYSLSDVATPDLATDWKNASDDSDASITVTAMTAGELSAGFKAIIADVEYTYQSSGSENGRGKFVDVTGNLGPVSWREQDFAFKWFGDDLGVLNLGNVSTPDKGSPEVSCQRNNVAAEPNWILSNSPPPPSDNADLASLTPSYGDLNPPFDPAIISYRLNSRDGTTLVAVTADTGATVDSPITLQRGVNSIVVTAEDAITTKTYTVDLRNPGHAAGAGAFVIQLTPEQIRRLRAAIEEEEFFIILAGIGC